MILCLGENDTNPLKLLIELSYTLKSVKQTNVNVLKVITNKYLNEVMLNNKIKNICRQFPNCTFLDSEIDLNNYYYTKKQYLLNTCSKINSLIDMHYYKNIFLTFKNMFKSQRSESNITNNSQRIKSTTVLIRTILYYFPIVSKNIVDKNQKDNTHSGSILNN